MFSGSRLKDKDASYLRWLSDVIVNGVGREDPIFMDKLVNELSQSQSLVNRLRERISSSAASLWQATINPFDKPNENYLYYRMELVGNNLVHTYCDYELAYRLGITTAQILGKPISAFPVGEENLKRLEKLLKDAWNGLNVIYFGHGIGQRSFEHYKCHLYRDDNVLVGKCQFVNRLALDDDISSLLPSKKQDTIPLIEQIAYRPLTDSMASQVLDQLKEIQ
jgi:hypothetical protein